jgi:hypothetical protein
LQPFRAGRYDYRGQPERGFEDICGLLRRSLSDRTRHYSYSLEIKEIIVSGDLAVVRLVWTFRVKPVGAGRETVSEEPGMEYFSQESRRSLADHSVSRLRELGVGPVRVQLRTAL